MPEKDTGLLTELVAGLVASLTVIIAFARSINLSKEMRDFKNEVSGNMKSQNIKLELLDQRVDTAEKIVPIELAKAKADSLASFVSKKNLEDKFRSQEDMSAERFAQIAKAHEELTAQNKEIFKILTDMRSETIRELKERVKELEK